MKQTQIIMGMPITVEVPSEARTEIFDRIFDYFREVDERYSPYKKDSELSKINRGLPKEQWSSEMKDVISLCDETKRITDGYFDIVNNGKKDPSGLVKGWAINNASDLLKNMGYTDFYIEAGGDIQVYGNGPEGSGWSIGIRSPFDISTIVKVIRLSEGGIATSGTYIRGEHIYNPKDNYAKPEVVRSLTVIGPNIYEADRFATAAFAMGVNGITFIDALPGFEGYLIDANQIATFTKGFEAYVA